MGRGLEPVHWAYVQKTFRTCHHFTARQLEAKEKASSTHIVIQGKSLNLFEPRLSYLKTEQIICPDNHTGGGESRLMRQQMGKRFVDSKGLWSALVVFTTLSQPQTPPSKHVGKYSI